MTTNSGLLHGRLSGREHVTENGTVLAAYALQTQNGLLAHIIERTAIHRDADGVIRYDADAYDAVCR